MGMRIGSTGSSAASQGVGAAQWQQRQQSMKDLMAALKGGDLGAAQKAFSTLPGASSSVNGSGPLAQIGQALQAGDLAGAQQAAMAWQATRSGHHHQHQAQATPAASSATGSGGSSIHLTA